MRHPAFASRSRLERRASAGSGACCAALLSSLAVGCVIPLGPDGSLSDAGATGDSAAPSADGESAVDTALPTGSWTNATGNLANIDSECGNMASVFAKPGEDLLIAGIALDGLWANSGGSVDGGDTWQALGAGAGSDTITNRPSSLVYDPQDPMRYWESGLYNGAGVYETRDHGNTFLHLGNVLHSDLVSVDFTDPSRKTLLAGSHEMSGLLSRSTDNGATWSNVVGDLPANGTCTLPLAIGAQIHLVGCNGYGGGPSGVYRTSNGGTSWTLVTASGGAAAPLRAADRSIYWASPNGNGLTRSVDDGQHWTDMVGPGVIGSSHPIELPNGWLATLGHQVAQQFVMVSSDHGATWNPATSELPYSDAVGVVYSPQRKAFYIWHFTCYGDRPNPVPADAIMRYDYDYQK